MNQDTLTVTICPTCNSTRIEKVCGVWSGTFEGRAYEVADLEYYACPECGEKVYPPAAMREIQKRSPGYLSRSARRHGGGANKRTARARS